MMRRLADLPIRILLPLLVLIATLPTVAIIISSSEPRGALIRNIMLMLLVGGVSLALSRLIGTKCIAEPLERLAEVSGALKTGNLAIRSELPHGRNEIGNLAQAFDEMARSVASRELERDRALEELEELAVQILDESARSEAVIAAIGDGISIQGTDFRILYQNEKHKAMLGDSVGQLCYEAYGLQPRTCDGCPITLAFTDLLVHTTERTVVGADGVPRHFEITASPVHDASGAVSAGVEIVRDITLRKTMEHELLRTNEALIKSNRELQHFAYITSHDLREPLRTITSFIQLLKKRYSGKLDRDADDFIGFIVDGADRMQQLIDDLLRYVRVDSKGKPLEPVDSTVPLKLALDNLGTVMAETGASVISDGLPVILGDRVQLIQLFQNLIGNAVKFKDEHPPEIMVSCSGEGEFWRFSVKDNGIGINPADSERIFDIFTKLHSREQYEGTGIGLAVCKKIVERHGGTIGVESASGKGATFHFTLRKVPS